MPQPPSPPPQLSRVMLATLVFTVTLGLPVDKAGGSAGQLAVGVWTWAVFLVLLNRINQQLRVPLMLCLVISTLGECCLSLVWGLYVYWLQNLPLFVPPGHVLLFTLGLTIAPHLSRWFMVLVAAFAAGYGTTAFLTSADTFSTALAILFLIFMAFGRHRRLYATMFVISLVMELYGTWIGNWMWVPEVPGLPLSSANPPLCVGALYCVLDLLVVNADRAWRRWRRNSPTPAGGLFRSKNVARFGLSSRFVSPGIESSPHGGLMKSFRFGTLALVAFACVVGMTLVTLGAQQQQPAPAKKTIFILGATKGWQHDSISDAMATIRNMGKETGLYDSYIRTDYTWLTKGPTGANGKNLTKFDALVFVSTTGEMDLTDAQKKDLLSYVHDDGKGFVGVHAALDANYNWPEYGEMIGGWFDEHPWNTFDAPIVREDATFPATKHFPANFVKNDEIYQAKAWSRDKVNVLLRLDETKLKIDGNKRVKRDDRDFGVAWAKMYGKGRVFYSTLGHTNESWSDPEVKTMYLEAIKWALGMTEGSTQTHARRPAQ